MSGLWGGGSYQIGKRKLKPTVGHCWRCGRGPKKLKAHPATGGKPRFCAQCCFCLSEEKRPPESPETPPVQRTQRKRGRLGGLWPTDLPLPKDRT